MAKERIFPFRSGQLIPNSPYRILKVLGAGGMAGVYRAEDVSLKKIVVVKMLHPELASTPAADLMRNEARALAAMHAHSNAFTSVLRTDDANVVLDDRGRRREVRLPYYVMELIEGPTLRMVLVHQAKQGEPLPIGIALGVARDVATALSHAHGEGIVHRDIKPENIMFHCKKNEPIAIRVIDFGVIGRTDDDVHTSDHGFKGTLLYAAPEQLAERPVSGATDLYSLGVVMYEMLAGQPPFVGPPHDVAQGHLYGTPQRLTTFRPDTPPGLVSLVDALLTKDPHKRVEIFRRRAALEGQHGLVLAQALEDIRRDLASGGDVALNDVVGDVRARRENTTDVDPSQRGRARRRVVADEGAPESGVSTAPGVHDLLDGLKRPDPSEVIVDRRKKAPSAPPPRDDRTDPMPAPPFGAQGGLGTAKTDVDAAFPFADAGPISLTKTQPLPIRIHVAPPAAPAVEHAPITPTPVVVVGASEDATLAAPLNTTGEIMLAAGSESDLDDVWQESEADSLGHGKVPLRAMTDDTVSDVESDSPVVSQRITATQWTPKRVNRYLLAVAAMAVAAVAIVAGWIQVEQRAAPLMRASATLGSLATLALPSSPPPEAAPSSTPAPAPSTSSSARASATPRGKPWPSIAPPRPSGSSHEPAIPPDLKSDFVEH